MKLCGRTPLDIRAQESTQWLFLARPQWAIALAISLAAAFCVALLTFQISLWIAGTVFLTILTIYHLGYACQYIVPLPHLAILISSLQYVLAAWLGLYVPALDSGPTASLDVSSYLLYGGPVIGAIVCGWALSLTKLRPARAEVGAADPRLLLELDVLLFGGLVATPLGSAVGVGALSFAFLLLGNLRFVGVFGRMVAGGRGWQWRLGIVMLSEVLFAADSAMFHPLLLWIFWTFAVWLYCFRPAPHKILIALACAALFLPALQEAKWKLRGEYVPDLEDLVQDEEPTIGARFDKAFAWISYLGEGLVHTVTMDFEPTFLGDTVLRYNQGGIIEKVIGYVPEIEPYARGETLKAAIFDSLMPRVFSAEKGLAGGRLNMWRFAGVYLGEQTSMNLGYAGEMYANFGPWGGIAGCAAYAFIFGLLFRWICRRAFRSPLWWSVVSFIFFASLKAEDGISEVLNWTVKSCLVMVAVYLALPRFRAALSGESRETAPPGKETSLIQKGAAVRR